MTFYQFLAGPRGAPLMEILMLGGQPDPNQWEHHERNWMQSKSEWNDKEKLDETAPDWALRVMWKSRSFMTEYWRLVNILMVNPFTISLEEILWSLQDRITSI